MDVLMFMAGAVVTVAAGALIVALRGYGKQKGKNLATREDLDSVHRRLEAMRSEFRTAESRVAAVHGHRFAAEMAILRELWERIVDFRDASDKVWYEGIRTQDASKAYRSFRDEIERLHGRIDRIRPFVPLDIQAGLLKAQLPIREMAVRITQPQYRDPEQVKAYLEEQSPKIREGLKELEGAITRRLWADDEAWRTLMRPESDV